MPTTAAVIGIIVGAAGTAVSVRQNRKAQAAEEKAGDIDRRQAEIENRRRIQASIEQACVQRASTLAAGVTQGAGGSSGLLGGLGAAQTQLGSNIGFANQIAGANRASNRLIGRANSLRQSGQTAQALGGLPTQFGFDPRSSADILQQRFGKA